ncbi:MAG: SDR family NAD(P)-dependent oxidoreductase [Thermoleophilia bacterium]
MSVRGAALVTGASSGLGREFAVRLAARGHPLVLVARRQERLQELAASLPVEAGIVVADLATDAGLAAVRDAVDALGAPPEVAVLNAGFGSRGRFWELDREREARMVRLNAVAVVDTAAHVLPGMVGAGRGALVVVSSAAAWQPVPYTATYAATKAFELSFTEAIAEELRGTGVRALAVCPGPTRTEFSFAAGEKKAKWFIPFDDPAIVVRAALQALADGRPRAATGPVARGSMLAARVLPRRLVVRAAAIAHRDRPLKGFGRGT